MRTSWTRFFRRVAAVCSVTGATAMSSAMCYAQLAFDSATDPVYADDWDAGDNGGFGFTPWNFDGTYDSTVGQAMDGSSSYNDLGTAWTLYNPNAPNEGEDNPPSGDTDIARAGRGFAPLQPGQTFSLVVDNPTERRFFRGYNIKFISGGESTCYSGGCTTGNPVSTRLSIGTFEYGTNGRWSAGGDTTLLDTDTDAGMRIDFTLTGPDTYELVMTPFDISVAPFTTSGALDGSGAIDWIAFELFNTDSDFHPTPIANPAATDFYISSMQIVPEPGTATLLLLGTGGALLGLARRSRRAKAYLLRRQPNRV